MVHALSFKIHCSMRHSCEQTAKVRVTVNITGTASSDASVVKWVLGPSWRDESAAFACSRSDIAIGTTLCVAVRLRACEV